MTRKIRVILFLTFATVWVYANAYGIGGYLFQFNTKYGIWGYFHYVELHEDSDSSEYNAGALSITGSSIPQSSVPVPAEVLLR